MTRNLFVAGIALVVPLSTCIGPVYAQESGNNTKPETASKPLMEPINEGELRLDGRVTAITGRDTWLMQTFSFTSPRGVTKDFEDARLKVVETKATTKIHPKGEERAIAFKEVKLGTPVAVIGTNRPDNSFLAREVILLEGYGDAVKSAILALNPETRAAVENARTLRDGGQAQRAVSAYIQALTIAERVEDLPGESLIQREVGQMFLANNELPRARAAFEAAALISRGANQNADAAVAMAGIGQIQVQEKTWPEAIQTLERAEFLAIEADTKTRMSILDNLVKAYVATELRNPAIEALKRLAPLQQASGLTDDLLSSWGYIAQIAARDDEEVAKEYLGKVENRVEEVKDPIKKGMLMGRVGIVKWRLKDRTGGRQFIDNGIRTLTTAKDEAGVTYLRGHLQALLNPPPPDGPTPPPVQQPQPGGFRPFGARGDE